MEDNRELEWYGWKDISISSDLIGDTITKGSGYFEKNYTYILIPNEVGYDNYCFLISSACVHDGYFSVCHDMNIELIYNPECREAGKKYKRYKMTGDECSSGNSCCS